MLFLLEFLELLLNGFLDGLASALRRLMPGLIEDRYTERIIQLLDEALVQENVIRWRFLLGLLFDFCLQFVHSVGSRANKLIKGFLELFSLLV